jgi:hypothetical protein
VTVREIINRAARRAWASTARRGGPAVRKEIGHERAGAGDRTSVSGMGVQESAIPRSIEGTVRIRATASNIR